MALDERTLSFQDHNGNHVSAILAEAPQKSDCAVVLCHGFLSTKNSATNRRLTELLTTSGITTFRFDWMGMGETGGQFFDLSVRTCCDQLEGALKAVRTRGYTRIGIIGSSFGGFIAILVAEKHSDVSAIGLKCPVPDFPEMLRLELGEKEMTQWKRTNQIPNVTGGMQPVPLRFAFYEECLTYDAYQAAESITAPVLIVHGDQDQYVPFRQIQQLESALKGVKELRLLHGADHHFGKPEDFRTMTMGLSNWAVKHLKSDQDGEKRHQQKQTE